MADRRTKFWQDNFAHYARTKDEEYEVNIYRPHSWERRFKVFTGIARSLLGRGRIGEGRTVLDIGCGTGMFSRILSATGSEVVGIDLCHEMLSRARSLVRGKVSFVNADCERLPFKDSCADFASANGLVTILSDVHPFLSEAARVLKPDGALMLESLNSYWAGRLSRLLMEERALPPDIGIIHYSPFKLGRAVRKALPGSKVSIMPIIILPWAPRPLETALQYAAFIFPPLLIPLSAAFIIIAERRGAGTMKAWE